MPLWLLGLAAVVIAVLFWKMYMDDRVVRQYAAETEMEDIAAELSSRDIESDRHAFERLVETCPHPEVSKESVGDGLLERLPPALKQVMLTYGSLCVGYERIGIDLLEEESPGVIRIGENAGVCQYAVRTGEETIYDQDYELNPETWEPRYASIYHWYIETQKAERQVAEEVGSNGDNC